MFTNWVSESPISKSLSVWHETHTLWDATYFGILAINSNASRNHRRDYDRLEYMVCAHYQCIYISALHPSFVLERRMVLIIFFANWHDAKLYRRGHWRNTVRGRGISFRFQCGNFFLASAVWKPAVSRNSMKSILQQAFSGSPLGSFLVGLAGSPAGSLFCFQSLFWHFSKLLPHTVCHGHTLPSEKSRGSKGALVQISFSSW